MTASPQVGAQPYEAHMDPMNSLRENELDLWLLGIGSWHLAINLRVA